MLRNKPLTPSSFKRAPAKEPKPAPGPRNRRCSNCGEQFVPQRMGQKVCSPACAQSFGRRITEQQEKKADKVRKQALKSRQQHMKETQASLNSWIRLVRDAGKPCISCQRHHQGQIHAGHYLSRGSHPHLALVEENLAAQCAPCNVHLSGNQRLFRVGLIERIGLAAVEALEADQTPRKYTITELQAIKSTYAAKVRAAKKEKQA